ncbi:MAG: ThiF family adenylyltransferase [Planctomycetota bacterium]|nr:ThiF family adenylyltransferase [Planctomycetota bacterium]
MDRYDRQQRIAGGTDLDRDWQRLRVLLVGCGGVGTILAQTLVRSGIGFLTVLDGDRVRVTDLHRQVLYRQEDADAGRAKVLVANRELQRIGGRTRLKMIPEMLTPTNAEAHFLAHDVVMDATDHIAARTLIDQTAMQTGIGWIHSGAIADRWVAASFLPPGTPCYHCWVAESPAPGAIGTCETDGVLPVACLAAASAAIRLLLQQIRPVPLAEVPHHRQRPTTRTIVRGSIAEGETTAELAADPGCTRCGQRSHPTPSSVLGGAAVHLRKLCGSGSVETWLQLDFDQVESRLQMLNPAVRWHRSATAIRTEGPSGSLICYRDGRALLTGDHSETLQQAQQQLELWLGKDALWTR